MTQSVTIIGIGHKKGTTRAGKEYDFYQVSFSTKNEDTIEGVHAFNLVVPSVSISKFNVGDHGLLITTWCNGKQYYDAYFPGLED